MNSKCAYLRVLDLDAYRSAGTEPQFTSRLQYAWADTIYLWCVAVCRAEVGGPWSGQPLATFPCKTSIVTINPVVGQSIWHKHASDGAFVVQQEEVSSMPGQHHVGLYNGSAAGMEVQAVFVVA